MLYAHNSLRVVPDPECIVEGTSNSCPTDLVEVCTGEFCECLDGMQRSKITNQCEWKIDIVCHKVTASKYYDGDLLIYLLY